MEDRRKRVGGQTKGTLPSGSLLAFIIGLRFVPLSCVPMVQHTAQDQHRRSRLRGAGISSGSLTLKKVHLGPPE